MSRMTTEPLGPPPIGTVGGGRSARRSVRGITLTELLIAIGIIGTLVGLLIPAVAGALLTAKMTQVRSDLRQVGTALHQYVAERGSAPPARVYCLTAKRHLYWCLPKELWETGCLDGPVEDVFNPGETYRYAAPGPGYANDSPAEIPLFIPEGFPEAGGSLKMHTDPERSPVRWVVWSVGPGGPIRDFIALEAFNPLDPADWYPEKPNGIICLYYDGNDWLYSY